MTPGKALHWHRKCSLWSLHRGGLRLSGALKLWPRWLLNKLAAQISYCLGSSAHIVLLFLLLLCESCIFFLQDATITNSVIGLRETGDLPRVQPRLHPKTAGTAGKWTGGWVGGCKKRAKCDVFWISVQDDYCYHAKLRHCSVGF